MACVASNACISCGSYVAECPVSVISEGDSQYIIDIDTCIDCGTYAVTCLAGAISEG